jgi:hypothetical protein
MGVLAAAVVTAAARKQRDDKPVRELSEDEPNAPTGQVLFQPFPRGRVRIVIQTRGTVRRRWP